MTVDTALGQAILVEVELRPEVVSASAHINQLRLDGSRALDPVETYTLLGRWVRLEVDVINGRTASTTPPEHGAVATASSQVFQHNGTGLETRQEA